ncbi:hypothetical protein NLJ89_g8101 [Agrocybe chaxingu]|uniref:Radical SAM core domain-containing protein n=1 Tax=Agrocybe chaxingu TaxID=84603 RepID=A0A9W8K2D8_9AGAR|nr:hypothetical protein NLJ89_g8101 [Agrocybe chaxingu]
MEWLRSSLVALYPLRKAEEHEVIPVSVNYFPHRQCNYSCEFCFHTTKNLTILPLDEAKRGLRMLADAGMVKLNISGGEPFLKPTSIGEVFKFCKEELRLESCSIVNNGSKVTEKWLDTYGQYLDVMALSCDSFDIETNIRLGRKDGAGKADHVRRVFEVAQWCRERGIKLKINSVITAYNVDEDMNEQIAELAPMRWKVFQVLLLDGENTGDATHSLRDARDLVITDEQFQGFLGRHKAQKCLVPEDNEAMKASYLNLDEEMRRVTSFLNSSTGSKIPTRSILEVGVKEAMKDAGFNEKAFIDRGGIFDWSRSSTAGDSKDMEW